MNELDELKWQLEVALREIDRLRAQLAACRGREAQNGLLSR